uniref:NB-ARC domain-containing protein n=1 Tax=Leersia perrieri TaxID=77586 RepID=A0A0D9WPD9_9ORYZ
MAETALGMAMTLVGGALSVASSAAKEEVGLLIGVQDDIWFINDELEMMQAFLKAVDGASENTGVLKAYLKQIRDMAYDIEDYLEDFMIFIRNRSLLKQLLSLGTRHRITIQIRTIKQRVQEVSQRNLRYNLIKLTPSVLDDVTRNLSALYVEESQLVGLDEPMKKLMEMINRNTEDIEANKSGPRVISVIGMGGLGKTTLANNVYNSKDLGDQFDSRAWITVSQSFDPKELIKEMINQMFGVETLKTILGQHEGIVLKLEHLTRRLQERLQEKRYFVVLDDVWTIEAWDYIKLSFPNNSKDGSCVVVTTRNQALAKICSPPSLIHQVEILEEKDAENLFLRKTNKTLLELEKDTHLNKTVEKILKKCGGLPLAILTVGGLLANKDTKEWEDLYNQLPSELESNPSLEALRKVVTLSYNHLPSHLKACFLHLSIFPEDFKIKRKHLVNRWIAEGFIITGINTRRTLEEIAESYFYELISRSMIQPSQLDICGNVKTCKLHDIVRDIAMSISIQENHVLLLEEHANINIATKESIRHVSCFAHKKLKSGLDLTRVRSFTLFKEPLDPIASLCSSKFKMLRVLDLSNAGYEVEQQDIDGILLLSHLKYVHFPKGSNIYAIPRSIENIQGLLTLDIMGSMITSLPSEIVKLQSLRSLRCTKGPIYNLDISEPWTCCCEAIGLPLILILLRSRAIPDLHRAFCSCWSESSGVGVPKGLGRLKELQTLEAVDIKLTSRKAIKDLRELTQLRKLVVTGEGASKKKCTTFCTALKKLTSLSSLCVTADQNRGSESLDLLVCVSSPFPCLERLQLAGYLQKIPSWVGSSVQLVKIKLEYCRLKEVDVLAQLPNLLRLSLIYYAYDADKLVFHTQGFPKLRILQLEHLEALREVTFEENTLLQMENITIYGCKLTSGIHGIKHLLNLRAIKLFDCPVENIGMLRQEVHAHPNHPVLSDYHDQVNIEEIDVEVEATESLSELGESSQS